MTRKNRLKHSLMLFMVLLLFISGMIPSGLSLQATNVDEENFIKPDISKDIEGEVSKEVSEGENYNYNVDVSLPDDLSGYESLTIVDEIDGRLSIQEMQTIVDGKIDNTPRASVEGQKVLVEFTQDQVQEFSGVAINLQITTQLNEDVTVGDKIENIAEIIVNDQLVMETNPVYIKVVKSESSSDESPTEKENSEENEEKEEKEDPEENGENEDNTDEKELTLQNNETEYMGGDKGIVQLNNSPEDMNPISQHPKSNMLSFPGE